MYIFYILVYFRIKFSSFSSGKCQIIHWRQGHKEECNPPSITHRIIDEGISSSQKAVKQENGAFDHRLETERQQHVTPIKTSHSETAFSNSSCSSEVSCERDDHIKVEFLADGNLSDSTSKSFSSSFSGFSSSPSRVESSDNVSVSTTSSELSDDIPVSESVNSNDPEKSDRHKCGDFSVLEKTSVRNNTDQTGLVDSVNNITTSNRLDQNKSICGDVETQSRSSSPSGSNITSCNESSVALPYVASSDFWEGTLDLNGSRNHTQADSVQSCPSRARGSISSDSESFLRFSFNLSGSTIPPLHVETTENKATVLGNAHPATLGAKKPIEGVASPQKIHNEALKVRHLSSLGIENTNPVGSGHGIDLHKMKSGEASASVCKTHPSSGTGGDSINIDAPKTRTSSSLSSERSNHVVSGKRVDTSHRLESREVESSPSGASSSHSSSSTEGHSVASLRSGKSAAASDLHLHSSTTGHPAPHVKSVNVDGPHTVASSSSQVANHSPILSNGLKTSVRKVVDQFRPCKLSKSHSLGFGSEIAGRCSEKVLLHESLELMHTGIITLFLYVKILH